MPKKKRISQELYVNPLLNEPVWLCADCQKTFATNYSLRRHMRLVHDAPKTMIKKTDEGVMEGHPYYD